MKKVRKLGGLIITMVMLVSLFAGCSPKQEATKEEAPKQEAAKQESVQNEKEEPVNKEKITIGISLPTQREERWVMDKENFEAVAKEMGIEVAIQVSDNDAAKQQSQCENLLSQGIDVLIVAPHDGQAAASIVEMAHKAGVKVIAYDRLIENSDVDLYLTFDSLRVGEMQGEWMMDNVPSGNIVLLAGDPGDTNSARYRDGALHKIQPRLDSGEYKLVLDQAVKDWQPSEAMNHMENALTANNNDIQGVIAPNDGTAGGVIQALAAQGLAGEVPVTGQDAEVAAAKRIIEGTQGMTVFNDIRDLGRTAMQVALYYAMGEEVQHQTTQNNGKIDVPTIQIDPKLAEKDNLKEMLIDSGFMNEQDIQ